LSTLKILIFGGSGLLGQYLNIELAKKHEIFSTYFTNAGNCKDFQNAKIDLSDFTGIKNIFENFKPAAVILAAAVSNPAAAEKLPEHEVMKINSGAPEFIAGLCKEYGTKLIFTSTDLVYDGNGEGMLTEKAPVRPVSLYARSKLSAEEKIKSVSGNYVILRTALLYGFGLNGATNHFTQVYKNLRTGTPVKLFTDQFRSPLALHDAARMIGEIIDKDLRGTFNFGGRERLSRFELGEILCEEMGCDKNLLVKSSMYEIQSLPKVKDVSMNTGKLTSAGIRPGDARVAIRKIINSNI